MTYIGWMKIFRIVAFCFYGVSSYGLGSGPRVNLLNGVVIGEMDTTSGKIPVYDRRAHFGGWLSDRTKKTCFNTRALVLQRDSETTVKTAENNKCRVTGGRWEGVYSEGLFLKGGDVDIDHMVPLYNAYYSGGWKWSNGKRCHYNNYMENPYHLITVSRVENRSKGAQGPDVYMPPKRSFKCSYLAFWLRVKRIWKLTMTPLEYRTIRGELRDLKCDDTFYTMKKSELLKEWRNVRNIREACSDRD